MEIREAKINGTAVVALEGRVDASNAGNVEQKLLGLIDGGERRLVLDLSALEYVSSAGLRVFLLAAKRISAAGGKLALAAVRDAVKEVLDMAGFSAIFQIVPTQKDALAAVQ